MKTAWIAIGVLVCVGGLSGCGGGSATNSTLTTACTSVAPPQLVYPAQGGSGIPASFNLSVGYSQNPGIAFGAPVLTPSSGASITGGPWIAAGSQWTSSISGLSASTTYSVNVTNIACNQKYTLGSFTTQ
jgi:hypothetical protein